MKLRDTMCWAMFVGLQVICRKSAVMLDISEAITLQPRTVAMKFEVMK